MINKLKAPIHRWSVPLAVSLSALACGTPPTTSSSSQSSSSSSFSSSSVSSVVSSSSSSSSSSSVSTNLPLVIAINSGATSPTTHDGVEYQADQYSRGGSAHNTTDPIAGTTSDALYQSERYGTYSYEIPVLQGTYSIKLHHAEVYWEEAGARTFNLSIEGRTELSNVDLYSQVGHDGAFEHFVENVRVNDGILDIALEGIEDAGTLSGFAVYSADGGIDTTVPVSNCSGYVGITYDDGPVNTTAFVNALRQANLVPVTFFVNGNNIGGNSAAISQMLTVGAVESHAYNHNDMGGYSYQQAYDELSRNSDAIEAAGAPRPTVFRPPYGSINDNVRQAARDLGMVSITWDVDSQDWNSASVSAIVNANNQLQDGQVILMHENQNNSLQAIPQIAALLESKGLCPGRLDPNTGRAVAP